MDDIINPQQPQPTKSARRKRRGWFRRLVQLALLLIVVGACVLGLVVYRTRSNPPFITALEVVKNDPQLIEHLGQPLHDTRWLPSGPYPEQFNLRIEGPKGVADVSVRARQFEGKWGLSAIDAVILEGGTRLSLDTGSENGISEAPTWSPSGGGEGLQSGETGLAPPSGVELELPDGPPGIHIELPETPPELNIDLPSVPAPPGS